MKYLIIERFIKDKRKEVYHRFDVNGRMLPEGVIYIDSWIDEHVEVCYQLMESDSLEKIQIWISNWDDLVKFEIISVISSEEARAKVFAE